MLLLRPMDPILATAVSPALAEPLREGDFVPLLALFWRDKVPILATVETPGPRPFDGEVVLETRLPTVADLPSPAPDLLPLRTAPP